MFFLLLLGSNVISLLCECVHGYKQLLTYSRMSVHACTFTPSLCMTQHPATQECPPVRGPGAAAPGQVLLHWARYPDRCREPGMETGGGDMSCWGLGGSTCHRQASLHYHPPLLWRFGLRSCKTIETRFTHTHTFLEIQWTEERFGTREAFPWRSTSPSSP